jgi:hypothetical protein
VQLVSINLWLGVGEELKVFRVEMEVCKKEEDGWKASQFQDLLTWPLDRWYLPRTTITIHQPQEWL